MHRNSLADIFDEFNLLAGESVVIVPTKIDHCSFNSRPEASTYATVEMYSSTTVGCIAFTHLYSLTLTLTLKTFSSIRQLRNLCIDIIDREFVTSAKKFANFNEFS